MIAAPGNGFETATNLLEWIEVADSYDQMLPEMVKIFVNPKVEEQVGDEGLMAAASLKAALRATYRVDLSGTPNPDRDYLRIATPGPEPVSSFLAVLHGEGGAATPYGIKLEGSSLAAPIQGVGVLQGSELLQGKASTWTFDIEEGGDSNPWVRSRFTPNDGDLPELSLRGRYYYMRHERTTEAIADGKYKPIEEVDPDIVKATIALTNAVALWISKPEDAQRTRTARPL